MQIAWSFNFEVSFSRFGTNVESNLRLLECRRGQQKMALWWILWPTRINLQMQTGVPWGCPKQVFLVLPDQNCRYGTNLLVIIIISTMCDSPNIWVLSQLCNAPINLLQDGTLKRDPLKMLSIINHWKKWVNARMEYVSFVESAGH